MEEPSAGIRLAVCPECGTQLPEGSTTCPSCGNEIDVDQEQERPTAVPSEVLASSGTSPRFSDDVSGEKVDEAVGSENRDGADSQSVSRLSDSNRDSGTGTEHGRQSGSSGSHGQGDDRPSADRSMRDGQWSFEDDDRYGPSPDPLIGMVIAGRYRIVELLGRGGMGVVYKVEHTEIGKMLALKLLAGEISQQREVIKRFKREALLTSRLSHPNCVQVFDYGTSEGLTFLVMELVVGDDLGRIIKREGPLPAARVAKIVVQVCSALAEAHALGIVHRDIKPENILLSQVRDEFEMVKVLDFGLAKLRESSELNGVTGTGQIIGTPYYMSPEQIHGGEVDGRTDIYALGAVMYEALTGQQVFHANTPMGVLTRHLTQEPKPFREVMSDGLPPERIERIVMRCLEKDPANRYQRVEDLQDDLVAFLHELGSSGLDVLLSNEELSRLQLVSRSIKGASRKGKSSDVDRIATRDEVEAFRRKLARDRWLSIGAFVLVVLLIAGGVVRYLTRPEPPVVFDGLEKEPNDVAAQANSLPFGKEVRGHIGRRIDSNTGDQDFFRVVVPDGVPAVRLSNSNLPNMPVCTWMFSDGMPEPIARYCTGRPGLALEIRTLHLDPGTYLLLVRQDRAMRGGSEKPMVMENVSDEYVLKMEAVRNLSKGWEVEPDDSVEQAVQLPVGGTVQGRFEWLDDVDVVCVKGAQPGTKLQWVVVDAEKSPRSVGAVLEVTRTYGPEREVPFRVHARPDKDHKPGKYDFVSPWSSPPVVVGDQHPVCLKLSLAVDPWAGDAAPNVFPLGPEPWRVTIKPFEQKQANKKTKRRRRHSTTRSGRK